jgi:peptidoglycan hydrolase-like protein with peptidoglycan-binding domain
MGPAKASSSISLGSLGGFTLRQGDHDKFRIWGGAARPAFTGKPVEELQNALVAIGTLKGKVDGQFGQKTRDALRRFQWYLGNMSNRLKALPGVSASSGVISLFASPVTGVPGMCDAALGTEILAWQNGNFRTTSPLVRLSLDAVSNVETSDTFTLLDYPSATAGEILCHQDFADVIKGSMNDAAKDAGVTLRINQSFRLHDVPPSGAVVPPASKSQHLIGHALDLNIVDGTAVNTTAMFNNGSETENAKKFIKAVKKAGLRWGGDFGNPDPPHFDDFVNPSGEDYEMNFFFAQHCYDANHPMTLVK